MGRSNMGLIRSDLLESFHWPDFETCYMTFYTQADTATHHYIVNIPAHSVLNT